MIPKKAADAIQVAVDKLFDRLLVRLVGPQLTDKQISIKLLREHSLPAIFEEACREEGGKPNREALESIAEIASNYIEAYRDICAARTLKEVNAFMTKNPKADIDVVLGGQLAEVWKDVSNAVQKVVEAETNTAKNVGFLDAITQISDSDDPVVYFSGPLDAHTCSECKRLFWMGDGHTPRLWYMSEVNHGYAKKGDAAPSIGGQHPNCFTDKRTPVLTEHGWKRINDIDINERVLTHKGVFKAVKGKVLFPYRRKPMFHVKYKFQNTVQTLRVTPDHQFLTPGGWKEARDLSVGDSLSRLVVPCAVCGAEASMESGSTGAFKMQHTCASKECVATLRKATVSKENVVGGVSTILNNHNGNYKFEWAEIVAVKEVRSSDTKNAMAYCLQVEDDESFVSKGVVSHNCRHSVCHMPPGYGFDAAGNIEYKHVGYDAIKVQRG